MTDAVLYHLTIVDLEACYGSYQAAFHIGIFESAAEAEEIAGSYLSSVPGFRDYPCAYSIVSKAVHGCPVLDHTVYWIQGWNQNEDRDEVDIIESDDYARRSDAEAVLQEMKARFNRSEWVINRSVIGRCDWQEGFERYTR